MLASERTFTELASRAAKTLMAAVLIILSTAFSIQAEEHEEAKIDVQYIDLKPSFVANFGGPASKLKFVKADISVRVHSTEAAGLIEQHMPLIRHEIVLLLSAQGDGDINTIQGQEALRLEALKRIQTALEEETGSATAEDLLFTNFVLQR